MKQGIHRSPAKSKNGRRMTKAKGAIEANKEPGTLTNEQLAWNARLEIRKLIKEKSRA